MKPEQKQEFKESLASLYLHLKEELGLKETPRVILVEDEENAKNLLGKTAHYEPATKIVQLNITDRHPKDILRSFAHEIIHHWQHERDELNKGSDENLGPGYAQKDPHMRKMEKQAYLLGNMMFRDWEDGIKTGTKKKDKVNEGPEDFAGCEFDSLDGCCLGPFIIYFPKDEQTHWLRGKTKAHQVFFDGQRNITKYTYDYETHGGLLDAIRGYERDIGRDDAQDDHDEKDEELKLLPKLNYDVSVLGRLFKIEGDLVVSFWNNHNQLKKIGFSKILPVLKTIVKDEGFDIKDVLFNPYIAGEARKDRTISYKELVGGESDVEDDDEQQIKDREIHLMSAAEKKKALQKMGAKPKVADIPQWKRDADRDVAENLQVTDRSKSKEELKNLLMTMIRQGVINSYNQKLTSGQMIPDDFAEEIATKLQVDLEKQINQVNWMGDKYIGPNIE